jgi:enoyl-CoA hydratase/carnithine racemase
VLEELQAHLDVLEKRGDLAGLIVDSAKPGIFIFGADVREFAAAKNITAETTIAMSTHGRKLFQRLSKAPFVTVAAIDGGCFGGGLELAMWCDRRVMSTSPKAQLGFPEVKLGIYPGWGGTARAPRIIGLANAVELVSSGENVDAAAAAAMGLISDCVPSERLRQAAIALVRAERRAGDYLADRKRWDGPIEWRHGAGLPSARLGLHSAADEGAVSGAPGRAGSDGRVGRRRRRGRLPGRSQGLRQALRFANQSGPAQCLLSHRPQQEEHGRRR